MNIEDKVKGIIFELCGEKIMLEYEKKILLTDKEYETIVSKFCDRLQSKRQINYYFDTDDFDMNKKGITCRIRLKDGVYTTTIKKHHFEDHECSFEEVISEKTEFDIEYFEKLNLKLQGELITERTTLYKDSLCEVVIDRNTYLEHTDFELEIEYLKEYEDKMLLILTDIARTLEADKLLSNADEFLNRVGQSKSKSQRFFERKYRSK